MLRKCYQIEACKTKFRAPKPMVLRDLTHGKILNFSGCGALLRKQRKSWIFACVAFSLALCSTAKK
jgi:hypothetical protein